MLPGPPSPTARLRPEVLGLFSAPGRGRCPGVGLTYVRGRLEGGARVWFGNPDAIVHLQGGLLLGSGALQPYLGLRAALAPGAAGYGGGAVVGGRLTLPAGFLALVELGADSFFVGDDFHHRFELTAQAGLGFQLPVP